MYYLPTPPYLLIALGLFVAFTSGLAFEATLKQKAREILKNPSSQTIEKSRGWELLIPFLGMCFGACLVLATGLETFNIGRLTTYAISLPVTIAIAYLIWNQLGKLLRQIQEAHAEKSETSQKS